MTAAPLITHRGVVYPWQCDHMGHMNVMWYVSKFDEATWLYFAECGMTPERLRAEGRGMAALEQHIAYKAELLPGDTMTVLSRTVEVRDKTLRFAHDMLKGDGVLAARCELVAVHLDTAARKGVALPADVADRARALVAE